MLQESVRGLPFPVVATLQVAICRWVGCLDLTKLKSRGGQKGGHHQEMKENSPLIRAEVAESSLKSLFGIGSLALLLSGIFQILDVVARMLIRPALTAYVSTFPSAILQEKDFFFFVSTHQLYY